MSGQLIGSIIGFVIGGPFGAFIGGMIGGVLFPESGPDGPRLDDLKPQSSEYGRPLAITYGSIAVGGNVIWASDLVEESHEEGGGFFGGGTEVFEYFGNMAVAVCEGERTLGRIWAGPEKRLIYDGATLEGQDAGAVLRWYSGTETQLPDALIESYEGAGNVPGYRGTAYLVLEHFPLLNDGNRLPFLTIEVAVSNGEASAPAPTNLGVVYVVQVLVFDDKYAAFYWGTFAGVVIRYSADDTLYAHYTYDAGDWVLTFDRWFWDEARNVFVRYTAGALSYTTLDVASGVQTPHTYSAAGGADSNPGTNVVGACMQSGSYVFAAKGSTGVAERVTLYLVDPATHTCTATYCGNLPDGEIAGPLLAPAAASYVVGYSTGATDRLSKFALSSGLTPTNMGSVTQDASYVDIDPITSYVWSVKRDGVGDITLTINDPATAIQVAQTVISGSVIAGIGSRPLTFLPGAVILTGSVWLATDGFRVIDPTTLDDLGAAGDFGDLVGGYYGTAAPMVVAYVNGGLIAFREGGMMTFGTTADPRTLNFLQGSGFVQETDNKYMGAIGDGGANGGVTLTSQPLSEIVADLSARSGLSAAEYDVTQLAADTVDGYAIERATTTREAITALMPAFFFDAVESGGKAKFVKRGGAIAAVIDDDELGAHESGSDPTEPLETTRRMENELPQTLNVRYLLQATDYDNASRYARRLVGSSGADETLDLPLVLSDTKAQEIAEVNLHGAWVGRLTYRFSLPRKYAYLEPTDIIVVQGYTMRLEKIKFSGGRFQCEARHDDSNVYEPHVVVTETPDSNKDVLVNTATVLELLGVNMIRDADDDAGFYAAVCAENPLATWGGATLYVSSNGGSTYTAVMAMPLEATMGYANTVLGNFYGGNIVDEHSSINVSLLNGSLSSTDAAGLLAGTNTAIIGDEIVYFRDATLQANGSYTLRGFLRGRRGSEYAMSTHAAADRFVLFNAAVVRVAQVSADIGVAKLYKAVHSGSTLSAATAESFTNAGNSLKPYAPVQLGGGRNAAGDLTLAWVRRGRTSGEWRDLVDVPLGETSEAYEVEIYADGTYATLKRTITGISSQSTSYTAAQQTTDFGSPQATVYFKVYQLSSVVGRGHAASGSV
jgi:hypothetical protein